MTWLPLPRVNTFYDKLGNFRHQNIGNRQYFFVRTVLVTVIPPNRNMITLTTAEKKYKFPLTGNIL